MCTALFVQRGRQILEVGTLQYGHSWSFFARNSPWQCHVFCWLLLRHYMQNRIFSCQQIRRDTKGVIQTARDICILHVQNLVIQNGGTSKFAVTGRLLSCRMWCHAVVWVGGFFETLVTTYQVTRHHITQHINLWNHGARISYSARFGNEGSCSRVRRTFHRVVPTDALSSKLSL
jgi:hypothetical protein